MGLFSKPKPKLNTSEYDKAILSNCLTIYADAMDKQGVDKGTQIKIAQALVNSHKIDSKDDVSPITWEYTLSLDDLIVRDTDSL